MLLIRSITHWLDLLVPLLCSQAQAQLCCLIHILEHTQRQQLGLRLPQNYHPTPLQPHSLKLRVSITRDLPML